MCVIKRCASRRGESLYDRLGGRQAIAAVVDEFVARAAADKRITALGPMKSDIVEKK